MARTRPDKTQRPQAAAHASDRARRRRKAAEQRARSSRILICEAPTPQGTPVASAVRALGFEVDDCASLADALRVATVSPCDVLIAVLPCADDEHLSLLGLLRRAQPGTPLVVVSPDGSLEMRVRCQPVRPFYFAVPPIPTEELRAIVNDAIEHAPARA